MTISGPISSLLNVNWVELAVSPVNADSRLLQMYTLIWSSTAAMAPLPTTVNASSAAAVSLNVTDLPSGRYSVAIAAVDVLGVTGPNVSVSFVVDLDAPIAWFTSTLPPYSALTSLSVVMTASDELSLNSTVVQLRHVFNHTVEDDWFAVGAPLAPEDVSRTYGFDSLEVGVVMTVLYTWMRWAVGHGAVESCLIAWRVG